MHDSYAGLKEHCLDREFWITYDGSKVFPANGNMTEAHIKNTMKYLCKPDSVLYNRMNEDDYYNWNPLRYIAIKRRQRMSDYDYINKRIKKSRLWHNLTVGLEQHAIYDEECKRINEGVLK